MSDVVDFSKDEPVSGAADHAADGPASEFVRQQSWPADGPAELELTVDLGRIEVRLDEQDGSGQDGSGQDGGEVRVEVRYDPAAGGSWTQGLSGIVSWLGGQSGPGGARALAEVTAEAVRAAEISWSEAGRRLVVRSSQELPLRVVPLAITVWAPPGSRLAARTGSGDITVTGVAGWAAVRTGSGRIRLDAVDGDADVTTGSGDVEAGPISGRARIRTGSGGVRLAGVGGTSDVKASSGDVSVGEVRGDLGVRTGSGEVTIADAQAGRLDLTTGSGGMRIGVHPGVGAELDLSSGSGRARSDLEVASVAPARPPTLHLRGRTGSGDVLVTRATPA